MIKLRNYQEKCISALRSGLKSNLYRQILCAATGAGKTVMFTYMVSRAVEKGNKCLILTDRTELLNQSKNTLNEFNLTVSKINPKVKELDFNKNLYVAMAQTLKRRIKKEDYKDFIYSLDLIIIDEAHKQESDFIFEYINEKCIVIGATATPLREGKQKALKEFYSNIVNEIQISELIELGFLANPISYGVPINLKGIKTKQGDYDQNQLAKMYEETKLYDGVYENYIKYCNNKKTLIFSPNVAGSLLLVDELNKKGLNCKHIDANTKQNNREYILDWFKNTPNAILSNVGILTTGFDEPTIEVVILYRATKSLPLFLQMVGRGSRTTPTKKDFTILDFGNNIKRLGFWQHDREWNLNKKKKKDGIPPVKECPQCIYIMPASIMQCPECGHEFEKSEKEIEEQEIVILEKLTYNQIKQKLKTATFRELDLIAKAKGYKKGWIYHNLKTEEDLIEYAKYKGYNKKWVQHQINSRNETREQDTSSMLPMVQ